MLKNNDIAYLVVHCSDTPNSHDLKAIDIHKMHLSFGWDGIGYHKIICQNGEIEEGRPTYWVGAHVYENNKNSLGVCLIGKDNFNNNQLDTLFLLLKSWESQYPNAEILGHRDFLNTTKTCPNFDVKKWWYHRKDDQNN
jgi:N-acetylmuramoyl-L-alanine amidase